MELYPSQTNEVDALLLDDVRLQQSPPTDKLATNFLWDNNREFLGIFVSVLTYFS